MRWGCCMSNETPIVERKFQWSHATGAMAASNSPKKIDGFIKGPIPLVWIEQASKLPGKSLHVGLVLWYLSGLKKTRTFSLGSKQLLAFGIGRDAKAEALTRLASAGLIAVSQASGRAPVVTILREWEPAPKGLG